MSFCGRTNFPRGEGGKERSRTPTIKREWGRNTPSFSAPPILLLCPAAAQREGGSLLLLFCPAAAAGAPSSSSDTRVKRPLLSTDTVRERSITRENERKCKRAKQSIDGERAISQQRDSRFACLRVSFFALMRCYAMLLQTQRRKNQKKCFSFETTTSASKYKRFELRGYLSMGKQVYSRYTSSFHFSRPPE